MNWPDVVIGIAAVVFLVVGWRRGLLRSLWAFGGLVLGTALGVVLVPVLLDSFDLSVWVSLAAVSIVVISAMTLHFVALRLDTWGRRLVAWRVDIPLDRLGGAVFGIGAVFVGSWMVGLALAGSSLPGLSVPVQSSRVLAHMERLDLPLTESLVRWFSRLGDDAEFERYVEPFAREHIVDVARPPVEIVSDPDVVRAGAGIVRVVTRTGPASGQVGTGFWIAPDRLMTTAHGVSGAERIRVEHSFGRHDAEVVVCDPALDVAVIAVEDAGGLPLRWAHGWPRQAVAILGFPDADFDIVPGRIRSEEQIAHADRSRGRRTTWALRAEVQPGNSGGPIVDERGDVLGMVILASRVHRDTAYALTRQELREVWAVGTRKAPGHETRCR